MKEKAMIKSRAYDAWAQKLVFVSLDLDREQRYNLISKFEEWYWDTDQDIETYALEFVFVVKKLLSGMLVINPKFLRLDDVLEELKSNLSQLQQAVYLAVFNAVKDGVE